MCGIAGIARPSGQALDRDLSVLAAHIARRGPDSADCFVHGNPRHSIGLAHARLAIIDLSVHANQPMSDPESGWTMVYNGEIYNYLELRRELEQLGDRFQTASDTEVLLKCWARWGLAALPRFNGMFAFAVYHARSGELYLVRDRFGVKPLLWARLADRGIAFGSSAAGVATVATAGVDSAYCARGLRYQAFDADDDATAFEGVSAVPAGGWMRIQCNDLASVPQAGRWYRLAEAVGVKLDSARACTDDALIEECRTTLADAVHLRLRSDVPVAVSLSGGLDSSTIAALASRRIEHLRGFSYGEPGATASEGPVVAVFSQATGVETQFIWPRHDAAALAALLDTTLAHQEAPFSGLSVLAQNEVYSVVRAAGYKVLLGGQGGDEAFAGYRKFFIVALREAIGRRDPFDAVRLFWSLGLMLAHEAAQARVYWHALDRYRKQPDFSFGLIDWTTPELNLWGQGGPSLRDRQIEDVGRWSIPTLLRYEDRNSMGHAVESRLPFMDYRLLELALALPARLKVANGFGKWALRRVTAGVVPDAIRLCRKKRGFDVTQDWVGAGLGKALRERIGDHRALLAPHLKRGLDPVASLSDDALRRMPRLLDEALMLAWIAGASRFHSVPRSTSAAA